MKLSVLIITKNEEEVIKDCIRSVKNIADEVIVVDSFSTDKTVQIATKAGAKVIKSKFKDFSDQRNNAIKHAKGEWILFLDADERATEKFNNQVEKIINQSSDYSISGYFVKRKIFYYGKDWNTQDKVQRLFKKNELIRWFGKLHETPRVRGEFGIIPEPILHFTHRNFEQMIKKTNKWSEYEAQIRLKNNHPQMTTLRFARVMATAFFHSLIKDGGYKNGTAGIIEAIYQSFSMFITYAKLWEMQKEETTFRSKNASQIS